MLIKQAKGYVRSHSPSSAAYQNKPSNPAAARFLKRSAQITPRSRHPCLARVTTRANGISVTQFRCRSPTRTTQTRASLPPRTTLLWWTRCSPLPGPRVVEGSIGGRCHLPAPATSIAAHLRHLQNCYRKHEFGDTCSWDSWAKSGRNGFQRCWAPDGVSKLPRLDPADM